MPEFDEAAYNPGIHVSNGTDAVGWTPIHGACYKGHTEVVQHLLSLPGIAVDLIGPAKITLLHAGMLCLARALEYRTNFVL
jgi:ankyrin repeat protein